MAEGPKTAGGARSERREQRLAAELRANLGKRKAQARARAAAAGPSGRKAPDRQDRRPEDS